MCLNLRGDADDVPHDAGAQMALLPIVRIMGDKMKKIRIVALVIVLGIAVHQLMASSGTPPHDWPAKVDQPYPDLKLRNHKGQVVSLSSYKGKVILIEPVGLSCAACNAFAGGNEKGVGGFKGLRPQPGLESIGRYLPIYSNGVQIDDPRLVVGSAVALWPRDARPVAKGSPGMGGTFRDRLEAEPCRSRGRRPGTSIRSATK